MEEFRDKDPERCEDHPNFASFHIRDMRRFSPNFANSYRGPSIPRSPRNKRRHPQSPHFHPFGPPLPMSRDEFKEIKHLMILTLLSEINDGITGYQLQEQYKLPRGSMMRSLNELEENKSLSTIQDVVKGRSQKIYAITDKGKENLEKLKEKWAYNFLRMTDIAPPEQYGNPFGSGRFKNRLLNNLENIENTEDAIDIFRGYRSKFKKMYNRLQNRMEKLDKTKSYLDSIITEIEKMDQFDLNKIEEMVNKFP